jgi:hypothetical protein
MVGRREKDRVVAANGDYSIHPEPKKMLFRV